MPRPVRHGTLNAYIRDRCRCDACRAVKADHDRARGAARREHANIDRDALRDLLLELFPLGLTADAPARRKANA